MMVVRRNGINMVMSSDWCQAHSKCLQNTRYYLFKKYIVLARGTVAKLMGRPSLQKELAFKVSRYPVALREWLRPWGTPRLLHHMEGMIPAVCMARLSGALVGDLRCRHE